MENKLLSVVVPCYNEELALPPFYDETKKYLDKLPLKYELIFVNDGSKDKTIKVALSLKEKDPNIKIIDFSRNFGKEAAMLAGLRYAKGDFVVIMDADLQDPPSLLNKMYEKLISDDDCYSVATYRVNRKGEPPIRSFFARAFYKLINKMVDVEIVDGARDYRMMKRKMVDAILELNEYHRFQKGIYPWVGFKTEYIEFENVERVAGETKWNFWKLCKYAIEGIVAFTTTPLRISTILGIIISMFGFIYMAFIVGKAMMFGDPVAGFPSLISIVTLLGGVQLIVLGVMGEYLAKTYMETKHRPVFIVKNIY